MEWGQGAPHILCRPGAAVSEQLQYLKGCSALVPRCFVVYLCAARHLTDFHQRCLTGTAVSCRAMASLNW